MNSTTRPLPVTVISCVYLLVGTAGFAYHFNEIQLRNAFRYDAVWVELVEIVAVVGGTFMLRGQNWARWLALTWIGFHVVLSAFHTPGEFAVHCVLCALIGWFLFRPEAGRYFRRVSMEQS